MAGCTLRLRSRSRLIASFLVAAVVCLAGVSKIPAGKVSAVRFWSLGNMTRVAVEVSADFKFHSERLTNPDRLFFDIQGARPEMVAKGLRTIAVGDGVLKQIRIAETQPGVTRVVLDLEQRVEFTASQLSSPDRLMIELRAPSEGKAKPAPVVGKVTDPGAAPPVAPPSSVTHPIALVEETAVAAVPAVVAKKSEPRKFEPPPHTEVKADQASGAGRLVAEERTAAASRRGGHSAGKTGDGDRRDG
jgi:N-acetylmuramoyl-L-alanine amidase